MATYFFVFKYFDVAHRGIVYAVLRTLKSFVNYISISVGLVNFIAYFLDLQAVC